MARKRSKPNPQTEATAPLNPDRLTPAELAAVLSSTGLVALTEADILRRIDQGAPVNPDETMSLVAFTAWLFEAREKARRGR
ncbi:MAG: hypothetical protein HND58_04480 [Planctomycetota bacterium]|nr:MAG: hypothetical protein HND58_04480 [Planctomycetota bacterium]